MDTKYDVIVIGGGVSGLSTAATLSKAGKKVLVLEQNFLLGGGASTSNVNGIDSEIGTYFLGEIEWRTDDFSSGPSVLGTLYDQLTDGQLEFLSFDEVQDKIYIGKENREHAHMTSSYFS